jgi:hypothetical protein
VVVAVLAARALSGPVAEGLATQLAPALARGIAPALVFGGVLALVSLGGSALLRATGLRRAVNSPADRAGGAVLSAAKTLAVVWLLLSALAVAGDALPRLGRQAERSQFASLAREHNLLERYAPGPVEAIEDLGKRIP